MGWRFRVYLQGPTTGGHTWAHHGELPVFCQWFGSGPVSGLMETSHRAHRRSKGQKGECSKSNGKLYKSTSDTKTDKTQVSMSVNSV